jgi:hypothetical protein
MPGEFGAVKEPFVAAPDRGYEANSAAVGAAGGEAERRRTDAIEPVQIVDQKQDRPVGRFPPQELKECVGYRVAGRGYCHSKTEDDAQRIPVGAVEPRD